jgi:hypothetical protein
VVTTRNAVSGVSLAGFRVSEVPMLDEPEFASVQESYRAGAEEVKHARRLADRLLSKSDPARVAAGVTARYLECS